MTSKARWLWFGAAGTLCVVLSSGWLPWWDALSGAFVPADIAQDAAAARLFVDRINPYGPVIREAHAKLLDVPLDGTFPHFPHPPFSLIVVLPLAFGSFAAAAALWFAFSLGLLGLLAALLTRAALSPNDTPHSPRAVLVALVVLLLWPPVLYNLEKGQWSILLAVLLAFAWRSASYSRWRAAAGWAAAAAAVKVYPVVLAGFFVLRSAKSALWFVATGLTLTVLPLFWIGPHAFLDFVGESRLNMPYWESFPSVMFSIHGAFARLFVGGQWAQPLVVAPELSLIAEMLVIGTLMGIVGWITILARRGDADDRLALVAWMILLPALNPQSLGHNGVLLALPIVIVATVLYAEGRQWQRWVWALAVPMISLPKQTVWRLAPPPIDPLEGVLVVAAPTWGTLLLFAVTVSLAIQMAPRLRAVSGETVPGPTAVDPIRGVSILGRAQLDFSLAFGRQLWSHVAFFAALIWPFLCKEH